MSSNGFGTRVDCRVRGGGPVTRGRAAALVVTAVLVAAVAVALRRPPRARRLRPRRRERALRHALGRARAHRDRSRHRDRDPATLGAHRHGCSPAPPRALRVACGGWATRRSVRRSRSPPSTRRHCSRCTRWSCRATASVRGLGVSCTSADVVLAALGIVIVGTAESGVIEHWFIAAANFRHVDNPLVVFDAPRSPRGVPDDAWWITLLTVAVDRDRRAVARMGACAAQRAPARHRDRCAPPSVWVADAARARR